MTCAEIPWIDYLEERLSQHDRGAVDAHLAGCDSCAREAARWRALIAAAMDSPAASRLGCPSAEELAALGTPEARSEVVEHVAGCAPCALEAEAVAGAELGVRVEPVPLPGAVRRVVTSARPLSRMASEVLAVVRARLGEAHPALERWRRAVAELTAPGLAPEAAYGALEQQEALPASEPLELRVQSGRLDVTVSARPTSVRVAVRRAGAPVSGVTVELEDALGEVKSTTTDGRGEAEISDDLPGRRGVRVREE